MAKIVDPDSLNQNTECTIHSGERKIQLSVAGNLDDNSPGQTSGVTHQAVYSFLKEEWMDDANLNKYRFPIKALTKFKFDWQNNWNLYDVQTRDLIRDGGWKEVDGRENTCIISLGDIDAVTDQLYYQRVFGFDQSTANFDKTGDLNEAYMSYSGEAGMDYTGFLRVFNRIGGKTYNEGNLLDDQGWASVEYDAYRIPLGNDADPNITYSGESDMTGAPYSGMAIQYIPGSSYEVYNYAKGTYSSGEVVLSGERWYQVDYNHETTANAPPHSDWVSFSGERELGSGEFYAFNRIIDGNTGTNQEIYEFAQYRLRSGENINDDDLGLGYGTVNGNVAELLLSFVGTTLVTEPGVFIDNYDPNYKNQIEFYDITVSGEAAGQTGTGLNIYDVPNVSTMREFPFTAAGTMVFNTALQTDPDAKYWMYFANAGGNLFDTDQAIVVNDDSGTPIQGDIQGSGEITFDFAYTTNNQGGRTPNQDADVVLVAMGLNNAEWVMGEFTITATAGLSFPVNAPDERNYENL